LWQLFFLNKNNKKKEKGESEDIRKTYWISWKIICLHKEYGGLGVRQLREFKIVFLSKWCWSMLVDRGGCGSKCWQPVIGWREGVRGGGGMSLLGGGRFWRFVIYFPFYFVCFVVWYLNLICLFCHIYVIHFFSTFLIKNFIMFNYVWFLSSYNY
jgi:hypothetical protein